MTKVDGYISLRDEKYPYAALSSFSWTLYLQVQEIKMLYRFVYIDPSAERNSYIVHFALIDNLHLQPLWKSKDYKTLKSLPSSEDWGFGHKTRRLKIWLLNCECLTLKCDQLRRLLLVIPNPTPIFEKVRQVAYPEVSSTSALCNDWWKWKHPVDI